MALINTLRNRMGKIVIVVIAFSMAAFILTDFLQSNSTLLGGQSNEIGEIASTTVKYDEFQAVVEELSYNFQLNTGRNPTSQDMDLIRNQAWQRLIVENVFEPQYNELGIAVTDDEMVEMVQGNNIHPQVRQAFSDPQTGVFNKDQLMSYLQQIPNLPPQNRDAWISFEESLRPQRALTKFENLMTLTNYASKYEAKDDYVAKNSSASADFLYVPYFTILDSTIEVSDSELKSYLSEHADEYQREETKSMDYVVFDIVPSAEDSALVYEDISALMVGLQEAEDDSAFATRNSEGNEVFVTYNPSTKPSGVDTLSAIGSVTAPTLIGNTYTIFKLSSIEGGDEAFVRARHILFKWEDDSDAAKREARTRANGILRDIRNGTDFAEMARIHGTDGTASQGGDLGWFGENGAFVQEFKDAAFGFRGAGLIPRLVETQFGYHIIEVTEPKSNEVVKVAKIEKELFVSDESLNNISREADLFAFESKSYDDYLRLAEEKGYDVLRATRLSQNDEQVGSLAEARNLVYWLFNKAEEGGVSEVLETTDHYIVAAQTNYQPKGIASLEDVRNEITRKVRDEKKADIIIEKLQGLEGTLEEMKDTYGDDARLNSAELTLSTLSITGVGYAPQAVGIAFALEVGELTQPFATDNGVIVLQLSDKTMAQDLDDYESYKSGVTNTRRGFRRREEPFVDQRIYDAFLEFADIEDNRYKFF
ncbi:MAG: SurA N-terminal domain-containing protein [Bacteroidota bacterium]